MPFQRVKSQRLSLFHKSTQAYFGMANIVVIKKLDRNRFYILKNLRKERLDLISFSQRIKKTSHGKFFPRADVTEFPG